MATIDNFQYIPVVGIERLIDPEQKQTDPLPKNDYTKVKISFIIFAV